MDEDKLRVALVHDVFIGGDAAERLVGTLREAREAGADLVLLPELPCNGWAPATREPVDSDAEPPQGPRHAMQSAAAREVGIGLLGGAIVRDPATGLRHNTALLFDATGNLLHSYQKVHVPQEPGFWEQDHYAGGEIPPQRIDGFALPLGVQICSDLNRPQGCHLLGAQGVEVVLGPRATEAATVDRWDLVIRANAVTSCCHVLSVNRPGPERGVLIGGPSFAVAPDGEVLARTEERMVVVELSHERILRARQEYPGYLRTPASLYVQGWQGVADDGGGWIAG